MGILYVHSDTSFYIGYLCRECRRTQSNFTRCGFTKVFHYVNAHILDCPTKIRDALCMRFLPSSRLKEFLKQPPTLSFGDLLSPPVALSNIISPSPLRFSPRFCGAVPGRRGYPSRRNLHVFPWHHCLRGAAPRKLGAGGTSPISSVGDILWHHVLAGDHFRTASACGRLRVLCLFTSQFHQNIPTEPGRIGEGCPQDLRVVVVTFLS